jgi:hypothetical protein
MYQRGCYRTNFRAVGHWGHFLKISLGTPYLVKTGHFTGRTKYASLLPLTLHGHKSAIFEWTGVVC